MIQLVYRQFTKNAKRLQTISKTINMILHEIEFKTETYALF